jgi:hypothetical protein
MCTVPEDRDKTVRVPSDRCEMVPFRIFIGHKFPVAATRWALLY